MARASVIDPVGLQVSGAKIGVPAAVGEGDGLGLALVETVAGGGANVQAQYLEHPLKTTGRTRTAIKRIRTGICPSPAQ